jgi:hypothetical protein
MFCKEELDSKEKTRNHLYTNVYCNRKTHNVLLVKMSRILKGHILRKKGLANTMGGGGGS